MIISIFASIGAQNLGDELILKNEIKLLEEEYGNNTKFIVYSYDYKKPFFTKNNIKYVEYFPVGIKEILNISRNIINALFLLFFTLKSDLIVIGGGGIIYDNEFQTTNTPLDLWIWRIRFFRLLRKKIEFFRIGLNIKNKENYKKIKKIFNNYDKISVRDEYSLDLLTKLGYKASFKKDPVFYDNGKNSNKKYLMGKISSYDFGTNSLSKIDFEDITVGIVFRSGYLTEESNFSTRLEEGKIKEIINYIVKQGGKVILLPHSFHKSDKKANDYLFLKKFANNDDIIIKDNMQDVYNVYINKDIDICFSMRLHSIILSHVYEIPFIGISYSKKTDEVLEYLKK